jgi:hypothetical protein
MAGESRNRSASTLESSARIEEEVRSRQRAFDRAELHADRAALRDLLTDDFLSIGPKGFVLDKQQWIDRHELFKYDELNISDVDVRLYDQAAIVRNVQTNKATFKDEPVNIQVRVSQTWVRNGGEWKLAGIQFSPMAEGA